MQPPRLSTGAPRGLPAFFEARGWEEADLSLLTGRRAKDVFATQPGPWAGAELGVLAAEVPWLTSDDEEERCGVEDPVGESVEFQAIQSLGRLLAADHVMPLQHLQDSVDEAPEAKAKRQS